MKDPGFLEEAKRSKLDVAPLTGDDMERIVAKSFSVSPDVLATAKKAME